MREPRPKIIGPGAVRQMKRLAAKSNALAVTYRATPPVQADSRQVKRRIALKARKAAEAALRKTTIRNRRQRAKRAVA